MIAAGAKQGAIAEALGVSTRQVKRYRADNQVRDRIAELVERHTEKIDDLFAVMLDKIEEGFDADLVDSFGLLTGAPDHRARGAAVKNMMQLAATLRPKIDKKTKRGLTLSELVEKYEDYKQRVEAGEDPLADEALVSDQVM